MNGDAVRPAITSVARRPKRGPRGAHRASLLGVVYPPARVAADEEAGHANHQAPQATSPSSHGSSRLLTGANRCAHEGLCRGARGSSAYGPADGYAWSLQGGRPLLAVAAVTVAASCLWSCGIPVSRIGFERKRGARRVYEVGAPPRFVADQLPAMSRARVVLRQQDVTGT